jgi:putative addiction module component (TIGR02574 family)
VPVEEPQGRSAGPALRLLPPLGFAGYGAAKMAALRSNEDTTRLWAYNTSMTQDATELLKRALALTEEERAELAGSLLESLDGGHEDPECVEAAWSDEIARRIEDLDSGKVKPVSLENFRRKLSAAAE